MPEKKIIPDEEMLAVTGGGENLSEQFSGLPIWELTEAPLRAAAEAQRELAKVYQEFLSQTGFQKKDTKEDQ